MVTPWDACQSYIKEKVRPDSFETWFRRTGLMVEESGRACILVPDQFQADIMAANHSGIIREALTESGIAYTHIKFVVDKEMFPDVAPDLKPFDPNTDTAALPAAADAEPRAATVREVPRAVKKCSPLNQDFTFDSFVVGESNCMAHNAARTVARTPGLTGYNPLVIYGGPGLGKTHLLHAIGNFARDAGTADNVLFMTSDEFLREFDTFLREKKSTSFQTKFKDADLLLIDDIQFFSRKPGIQEQFLQVFNHLALKKKQIVLSSDRRPEEIPDMMAHLINRFKGGLNTDIQPPDFETRMAILRKKAEALEGGVSDEVVRYIAEHITSSVRELEGTLYSSAFHAASLKEAGPALQSAQRFCGAAAQNSGERVSVRLIMQLTAEAYGTDLANLSAKSKKKEDVYHRDVAMYLCKTWTKQSTITIGEAFGGRTHSTVLHAANKIKKALAEANDAELQNVVARIENQLKNKI